MTDLRDLRHRDVERTIAEIAGILAEGYARHQGKSVLRMQVEDDSEAFQGAEMAGCEAEACIDIPLDRSLAESLNGGGLRREV